MKRMGVYAIDEYKVNLEDWVHAMENGRGVIRVEGNPADAIMRLDDTAPELEPRYVEDLRWGRRAALIGAIVISVMGVAVSAWVLFAQ